MSNPVPEVMPEEIEGLAAVIATGRSDYPNQINNVLAFPGVFRGALDVRATAINEEMKLAAAHAIAEVVKPDELGAEYIVPSVFNRDVAPAVAARRVARRPSRPAPPAGAAGVDAAVSPSPRTAEAGLSARPRGHPGGRRRSVPPRRTPSAFAYLHDARLSIALICGARSASTWFTRFVSAVVM